MKLSFVVPIFNELGNLRLLVEEVRESMMELDSSYELILVDDGSSDGSRDLIAELAKEEPWIRSFALARNFGQTAALSYGINQAVGDYVVTLDADLQNDPKDALKMIDLLDSGYDFVAGWRANRRDPWLRSVLSRLANRIISRYSKVKLHDYGCTLKAFRSSKLKHLKLFGEMHRFIPIYMDEVGARSTEIVVNHRERTWGSSKYGFNRIAKVLVDLLVVLFLRRYLARPMHIFGAVGISFFVASFSCFLFALILRIIGYSTIIQTPLPLLGGVFFIAGATSWLLGLVAEIVVRIFFSLEPTRAVDGQAL